MTFIGDCSSTKSQGGSSGLQSSQNFILLEPQPKADFVSLQSVLYPASSRTMRTAPYQQPGNCAAFCIALPCLAACLASPRLAHFGLIAFAAQFTLFSTSVLCEFLLLVVNFRYILPFNPCLTSHHLPPLPCSRSRNRATPTPGVLITTPLILTGTLVF